jgi:hypothetical protein
VLESQDSGLQPLCGGPQFLGIGELVSNAVYGENELRPSRIGLDFAAKVLDVCIHRTFV